MTIVASILIKSIFAYSEHKQKSSMQAVSQSIAQSVAAHDGKLPDDLDLYGWLDDLLEHFDLNGRPMMIITDHNDDIIEQFPQKLPLQLEELYAEWTKKTSEATQILSMETDEDNALLWVAVTPVIHTSGTIGYVWYLAYKENVLEGVLGFSLPRFLAWWLMMICSWLVIFAMIKHLIRPIQEVSEAAKKVVAGEYRFKLVKKYKEREIYELMTTFEEMAEQLRQMEALRAQLLAGITHELKTPVTSISGLVQAVNDRVVVGEEADEFLGYCIVECHRLKKMIDDLLDFNSFVANGIQVKLDHCHLKEAVQNIVNRWLFSQEYKNLQVNLEIVDDDEDKDDGSNWTTMTEIERLEQVISNLLNNARDAMKAGDIMTVKLKNEQDHFLIQVEDTGEGIPREEQEHIFEPFYRGDEKKTRVRGLGIGLPFSRLIAQSLGGQLVLTKSTSEGTCFSLYLPKKEIEVFK